MNNTLNFKMSLDSSDFTQKANDAKNAINGMGENVKKSNTYMRDYMREIKNLKAQLLQLEEGTEEYAKAMQLLADKTFALKDIQETASLTANDLGERFNLMTKTLSGIAGGFGALQGAMNLFGVENEAVNQALLKLQSIMAIVQGLEGLEGLSKTLPACINMFKGLTVQSKLCAVAMKSIPYVAVASAIVGIVGYLSKQVNVTKQLTEEEKKAEEQAKRLKAVAQTKNEVEQQTTKNIGEMMGKYKLLQVQWNLLGDDLKDKEQFIKDNAKAFNDLGIQVDTVADAERILINDTEAFCNAMTLRAQSIALQNQIVEESDKYFKKYRQKGVDYGTHYKVAKEGDYFASPEEAKAVGREYMYTVSNKYSGTNSYRSMITKEDVAKVNAYRNQKALELNKDYKARVDAEYNAIMNELTGQLQKVFAEQEKNPYGNLNPKSDIPVYDNNGGGGGSSNNNKSNTTTDDNTTPQQVNLIDLLKTTILTGGNLDDYNKEYTEQTGNEINSKNYWDNLTMNLRNIADSSGNSEFVQKIETIITKLPTYEKPQEEKVEVNVNAFALDALHTGDYSQLDNYIEQQTKAQKGSMKFFEQKINILQDVADTSSDLRVIDGVDKEVDRLKKELENLKQQIAKKTGKGDELPSSKKITSDFEKNTKDITTATSAIGNAFSTIAGMTDDATSSWLNYFGQVLATIPQLITAFTSLAATEAAAGQAAQGPFGWLGIPVAIATTLSAILTSIPKFSNGGIVGGNSYSGDKIICGLNSGEMILNSVCQRNLFNLLKNGGTVNNNGGTVKFKIQGQELVGVLNNYNNKMKKVL